LQQSSLIFNFQFNHGRASNVNQNFTVTKVFGVTFFQICYFLLREKKTFLEKAFLPPRPHLSKIFKKWVGLVFLICALDGYMHNVRTKLVGKDIIFPIASNLTNTTVEQLYQFWKVFWCYLFRKKGSEKP
jgi:hypothetical protein